MTPEPETIDHDWVYVKLYAGAAADRFDYFLTDAAREIVARVQPDRWFFLRYADQAGPHLRLRLRTAKERAGEVLDTITPTCELAIQSLATLPPADYQPLIPPSGIGASPPNGGFVGVLPDTYEPEYDKFGGATGIAIAEAVFETSSEIAIAILRDEQAMAYSRKTALPILMAAAARAFVPRPGWPEFWDRYSRYWLGTGEKASAEWTARFRAKALELEHASVPIVPADASLHPSLRLQSARWRAALDAAAAAYASARVPVPPALLASQFSHLMNNRLGCMPLEEAYLAALLQHEAEHGRPA